MEPAEPSSTARPTTSARSVFSDVPPPDPAAAAATVDADPPAAVLASTVGVHCPVTLPAAAAVAPGAADGEPVAPVERLGTAAAERAGAGWLGGAGAAEGDALTRCGVGLVLGPAAGPALRVGVDVDVGTGALEGSGLLLALGPIEGSGAAVPAADAGPPGPASRAAELSTRTSKGPVTRRDNCTF